MAFKDAALKNALFLYLQTTALQGERARACVCVCDSPRALAFVL